MSVYSVQLGATFSSSSGNVLLFTADALYVYIVRDLVWCNDSATSMQGQVYLQDPGLHQYPIIRDTAVPATTPVYWSGRQVIPPDWELWGYGALADWSVLASGYKLPL